MRAAQRFSRSTTPSRRGTRGGALGRLWRGDLPLAEAFWTHAIAFVGLANLGATFATLVLLTAGVHPVIAVAVFLTPAPYGAVAVVGVWRSADRSRSPNAAVARWTALVWWLVMLAV